MRKSPLLVLPAGLGALLLVATLPALASPSDAGLNAAKPAQELAIVSGDAQKDVDHWTLQASDAAQPGSPASPFIQSDPRQVAPFPILLNRSVQQYVSDFLTHSEGLRLSFERSRPFLSEMIQSLEQQGVPGDFVYLAFAESRFTERGKGPWQFNTST